MHLWPQFVYALKITYSEEINFSFWNIYIYFFNTYMSSFLYEAEMLPYLYNILEKIRPLLLGEPNPLFCLCQRVIFPLGSTHLATTSNILLLSPKCYLLSALWRRKIPIRDFPYPIGDILLNWVFSFVSPLFCSILTDLAMTAAQSAVFSGLLKNCSLSEPGLRPSMK